MLHSVLSQNHPVQRAVNQLWYVSNSYNTFMRFVSDLLTQPLRMQSKGGVFTNQMQIQWVRQLQLLVVIAHERIKGIIYLVLIVAHILVLVFCTGWK